MDKYVIVKEASRIYNDRPIWIDYKTYFGLWGWATCIADTLSVKSAEECEENLYKLLHKMPELKSEVIKEIEL